VGRNVKRKTNNKEKAKKDRPSKTEDGAAEE
jgi:hypothetical protein